MKKRVIFKNGRYFPQYKFAGLLWQHYREGHGDPLSEHFEVVSFFDMLDAINYCSSCGINNPKEEVVWSGN